MPTTSQLTRRLLGPIFAIVLLAAAFGPVSGASAAGSCSSSFQVLHNDQIGTVKIPSGQYTLMPTGVTCKNTAILLSRFLNDFDGILPDGWSVASGNNIRFVKAGTAESFQIRRTVKPSSGGRNISNGACPGTFSVLHNDKIGALKLKAGQYKITTKGLLCWFDATKLAYFLNYNSSGKLPKPWTIDVAAKQITRSPNHYFSLKYTGPLNGGGQTIAGGVRCAKKLFNQQGSTVAGLAFPRGYYYLNVFGGLSCTSAGKSFNKLSAGGAVPSSWTVNSETGTFMETKTLGFQLEGAF
jgi:hypothetical protein